MTLYSLFFIYGLCVMFYFMMSWFFFRKDKERLSKLVAVMMAIIGLQCLKDLFFISPTDKLGEFGWRVMTVTDMVTVPMYAFILIELCKPSSLTLRTMVLHELTFIVPMVIFIATGNIYVYYAEVIWAFIYGICYAIWTIFAIPRYHALLKRQFSYGDNIDLRWLRAITAAFFIILSVWICACMFFAINIEAVYLIGSLVMWKFICYFIYRHESVLDEISETCSDIPEPAATEETGGSELGKRITALFTIEKIYLDPNLKLSDIAKAAGTNRTYVSAFFNKESDSTFYDYVNSLRIEHACRLLLGSGANLKLIAEQSGFNSQQSFIRVFNKIKGISPSEYRASKIKV